MDTTETYRRMCDTPEIQGYWIGETSNWMFWKSGGQVAPIWLPRQDQLQEMVEMGSLFNLLIQFERFLELKKQPSYAAQFRSLEQLWLAYVMREMYHKEWNGRNWEVVNA